MIPMGYIKQEEGKPGEIFVEATLKQWGKPNITIQHGNSVTA